MNSRFHYYFRVVGIFGMNYLRFTCSRVWLECLCLYGTERLQLEQGMNCGWVLSSALGRKLCLSVVHAFPCLDNQTSEGRI